MIPSRWRSRPRAGCSWPACAPPAARSIPSTRWRWPVTGTGTRSRAGNPTRATRSSWPACCAPTCTRTGRCPLTASSPGPSQYWPAPSRTPFWDRTTAHNKLRSQLREYFPGFLAAFAGTRDGIMRPEARAVLAAAPTPADAARLTVAQLRALLKKAGRSRGIDAEATRLREAFRAEQMRQLPLVEQAMGRQALALLRQLDAACASAGDLEAAAAESFNQHPDAGIITSFPGLGPLTGARVLAETGDDRSRFNDARGLKAYAGAAPITRASGKIQIRHPSQGQEQQAGQRRIHLGVLRPDRITRRSCPLRPPPRNWRPAQRRPAQPVQPATRLPPPLPGHWPALRRNNRIPRPGRPARRSLTTQISASHLTTKQHRMSHPHNQGPRSGSSSTGRHPPRQEQRSRPRSREKVKR